MLRKIVSIGSVQLIGIVINALRSKLFAVLLGPAGFGVVATIDQLVVSSVQISNLGLPVTALKFLSRSHSLSEEQFRKSYSAFFKAMALLAFVATVITLLVVPTNLARLDPQLAQFRQPVTIALFGIPATMILSFLVSVLAARRESIGSVLLTVVFGAVILVAGGVGCLLGGTRGIYLGIVPASTMLVIATIIFLRTKMNLSLRYHSSGIWDELRTHSRIIEVTIWVYVATASYSALLLTARYASITHLSTEAAGLLQACLGISLSIGAVLLPANTLYFSPYINRAIAIVEKHETAANFLPRLVFLYCLGALPVLLFPQLVLHILFSARFTSAAAFLPWFLAWQCLFQISNVYQQLLLGLDDAPGFGVVTSLGYLFAAGCSIWLVNRWGLYGISLGFVAGATVTTVLTIARLRLKHGLAAPKSALPLVAFTIGAFWVVAALGRVTAEATFGGVCARLLTAAVFLAGLWWILPRALRGELFAAALVRVRALARRTAMVGRTLI